jgi:hypothetical protein
MKEANITRVSGNYLNLIDQNEDESYESDDEELEEREEFVFKNGAVYKGIQLFPTILLIFA